MSNCWPQPLKYVHCFTTHKWSCCHSLCCDPQLIASNSCKYM